MIPTTTTATPAIRPTSGRATAPAASDRPVVVRASRAQRVAGGALVLAAVGVAVGVSLVVRSDGTAAEVAAPTVAAATYTVGDTAHGGPGSSADVLRDAPSTPARSAAVIGETAHGGPGSHTDAVRPLAPRTSDIRVADVAHGTAGGIVTATSARP